MLRNLFLAAMTIVMIVCLGLAVASADEPNDGPEVTAEQMREWYPCPYAGLELSAEVVDSGSGQSEGSVQSAVPAAFKIDENEGLDVSAAAPTPIASSITYAPVYPVPGDPSLEPPNWWAKEGQS